MTERDAIDVIMQVCYDGEFPENSNEAFEMAVEALEKQIAKKPFYNQPTDKLLNGYYICSCGANVGVDEYKDCFCHNCGQKLLWESEEE